MARSLVDTRPAVIGRWLFAATVPASVMALGSLVPTALVVMSLAAATSCALLWYEPPRRISRAARLLFAAWALLVFATVLQAVPLPAALVRVIAPANADIWERALAPFHEGGPGWITFSVAPAATRIEVLRGLFYGCVFSSAIRIGGEEKGTTFLERLVIVSASALALVSLAHAAVDAKRVFGVYSPREIYAYMPGRYGPLLNVNHLTAYLNAGACVALGSLLSGRPVFPKPLLLAASILLAGTSVWAASRGGTGSLAVGIIVTVGLSLYTRRRFASVKVDVVVPIALVVAAAAMIGLGLSEDAREDLANRDVSKVSVALNALRLVPESPWIGFGRGAFETVFPLVRRTAEYTTFTNPENVIAQWASEWGVPFAAAGAVVIAFALRPSTVIGAARPAIGSWAAIVAVTLHDLVDFHLEVPGVTVIVAVAAATVTAARAFRDGGLVEPGPRRARAATWFAAVATFPAVLLVLPDRHHLLLDDRNRLAKMAVDAAVPPDAFRRDLRAAMLRYPGEAFFPLLGRARSDVRRRERRPVGRSRVGAQPALRSCASRPRAESRRALRRASTTRVPPRLRIRPRTAGGGAQGARPARRRR